MCPQLPEKQSTDGERGRKMSAPSASGLLDKSDDYFELPRHFVKQLPKNAKSPLPVDVILLRAFWKAQ